MMKELIPKSACQDRTLYRIRSRNLTLGVYNAPTGGFIGLRRKWSDTYLSEEYHYDNGPPYGTARPVEALPDVLPPELRHATQLGTFCDCGVPCAYVPWPEGGEREVDLGGGKTIRVPGEWRHLEATACTKILAHSRSNKPLDDWMHAMEEKYLGAV